MRFQLHFVAFLLVVSVLASPHARKSNGNQRDTKVAPGSAVVPAPLPPVAPHFQTLSLAAVTLTVSHSTSGTSLPSPKTSIINKARIQAAIASPILSTTTALSIIPAKLTLAQKLKALGEKIKRGFKRFTLFLQDFGNELVASAPSLLHDIVQIAQGAVSIATGNVMGAAPVAQGVFHLGGTLVADLVNAVHKSKQQMANATITESGSASKIHKVIDTVSKIVNPIAGAVAGITSGTNVVGGAVAIAETVANSVAQVGADISNSTVAQKIAHAMPQVAKNLNPIVNGVQQIAKGDKTKGSISIVQGLLNVTGEISQESGSAKGQAVAGNLAVALPKVVEQVESVVKGGKLALLQGQTNATATAADAVASGMGKSSSTFDRIAKAVSDIKSNAKSVADGVTQLKAGDVNGLTPVVQGFSNVKNTIHAK
ncbi:UNVERIFIED_CONTAM: hypothetical protein HDU68_004155 [Siphonaria sp. JEL0065]|nr:hypothetical protein HDU68_004155 [Siphonaria sp. JEL0065]